MPGVLVKGEKRWSRGRTAAEAEPIPSPAAAEGKTRRLPPVALHRCPAQRRRRAAHLATHLQAVRRPRRRSSLRSPVQRSGFPTGSATTPCGVCRTRSRKAGSVTTSLTHECMPRSVRRGGRWRVPQRMTTLAYKGSSLLDVRAAELTSAVTTIRAFAYKSDVEIIVPPGVRVVVGGFGVSQDLPEDGQLDDLSQDAPVLHVRGFAYKGRIEIRARPGRLSG